MFGAFFFLWFVRNFPGLTRFIGLIIVLFVIYCAVHS